MITTRNLLAGDAASETMIDHGGPVLEVRGLLKTYGSLIAVEDLDLRIERGSVVGFLGLNGAGKTTALRMMCGLVRPDAGTIRIGGDDLRADPVAATARVGYVADRCRLHGWMQVREAVDFHRRLRARWDAALANELMAMFGFDPRQRVKALSKGMQAKLSLVLALAHRPDVLLLDEPLDGLDVLVREAFLDGLLRQVIDAGQTILFSTHALADVDRIADSVAILHRGRLRTHAPLTELIATTRRIRVDGSAAGEAADPGERMTAALAEVPDLDVLTAPRRERRDWIAVVRGDAAAAAQRVRAGLPGALVSAEPLPLVEIFRAFVQEPGDPAAAEPTEPAI